MIILGGKEVPISIRLQNSNEIVNLPVMNYPRFGVAALLFNNRIYVFGGVL